METGTPHTHTHTHIRRRSLKVPSHHASSLPSCSLYWKSPHSIRITGKITGQWSISVSFPRFLRKLWLSIYSHVDSHINTSNTSNHYQSACRKFCSAKTALLKIHSDILSSMDDGWITALTLLDLFAAFDTTDHTFLLSRLYEWFGITGKPRDWFKSYLTERCQRIKLGDCISTKEDLLLGVSQGPALGPLLFTVYTTLLNGIISGHAIPHHLYADDSQLYVSFASGDFAVWYTIKLGFCSVMHIDG